MWCVSVDGFSFREDWNRVERSFLLFSSVRNERILRRRRSLFRCRMRRRRRNKVVLVSGSETKRERTTERRSEEDDARTGSSSYAQQKRIQRPRRWVITQSNLVESSLQKKHRILREKTTKRGRPSYHVNTKCTLSLFPSLFFRSTRTTTTTTTREPLFNCFCDVIFCSLFA